MQRSRLDVPSKLGVCGPLGPTGIDEGFTRRALLRGAVSSAAALGLTAMWGRTAQAAKFTDASRTLNTRSTLLTLVNRLTNGYSESEYARAQGLGYAGYLANMLTAGVASEPALEALLSYAVTLGWSYPNFIGQPTMRDRARIEVADKALYYAVLSANQFKERMVEFWRDHFNVYSQKDPVDLGITSYDRDVLRALATANFPTLLMAVEKHGAMLTYLDNQLNKAPIPNENLAREILELHTVSPIWRKPGGTELPNYTEADVVEFARCISGWSASPTTGNFVFRANDHIGGAKTVMGISVPEDLTGPSEGELVLNTLSIPSLPLGQLDYALPAFLARKLARWFLHYDPTDTIVTQARNQYVATGGDIFAMVQSILQEPNVAAFSMPATGGPDLKLRRPQQWMAAALRALELPTTAFQPAVGVEDLAKEVYRQGNGTYAWPAPDGFPDREEAWAGPIFSRWIGAANLFLAASPFHDVTISEAHLDARFGTITTIPQAVARLDQIFTGGVMTTNEITVLRTYLFNSLVAGQTPANARRELCMLAACSPTFNYY